MKILLAALALATGATGGALALLERLPPAPAQPMRFSHRVHAGDVGLACTFCHVYADRSPVAGVPSMARCGGCHRFIREDPGNPAIDAELKALGARLAEGGPLEWVRVHRLPDHVRFTHERHVRSGVACRECHGEVERMEAVAQVATLRMGWCLECHRDRQAREPAALARLTECVTCHK